MTVSYSGRQLTPLEEIELERVRQNEKWGKQNHPDGTGQPGDAEAAQAARLQCQDAAADGQCTWRLILREEMWEAFAESDPQALRAELVQIAAVATQWVEAIDRRQAQAERIGRVFRAGPSELT